jgi:hypothetical protein
MTEAVDVLLDRSKRLGIWASRKPMHLLIVKLGTAGELEHMRKIYGASRGPPLACVPCSYVCMRALMSPCMCGCAGV